MVKIEEVDRPRDRVIEAGGHGWGRMAESVGFQKFKSIYVTGPGGYIYIPA
jgi:hypothetical protein